MPKPPTMRSELLEFLSSQPQPITSSITELAEQWNTWRAERGLPPMASTERSFRQAISKSEELGFLRMKRRGRNVRSITIVSDAPLLAVDSMRRLERERAALSGRFTDSSTEMGRDLLGLRTPALNAYVRQRRAVEKVRREYAIVGLSAKQVPFTANPLGEEALALKERLVRVELELLAWRELGSEIGREPQHVPNSELLLDTADAETAAAEERQINAAAATLRKATARKVSGNGKTELAEQPASKVIASSRRRRSAKAPAKDTKRKTTSRKKVQPA